MVSQPQDAPGQFHARECQKHTVLKFKSFASVALSSNSLSTMMAETTRLLGILFQEYILKIFIQFYFCFGREISV